MINNVLSIEHLEYEQEVFELSKASYNVVTDVNDRSRMRNPGLWDRKRNYCELVVSIEAGPAKLRAVELDWVAPPVFEITALIEPANSSFVPGQKLYQLKGFDDRYGENLSNFYYFEHWKIDDVVIEFLEIGDDWINVRIKGVTLINGSNGNDPDASFQLQSKLIHDPNLKRGVM